MKTQAAFRKAKTRKAPMRELKLLRKSAQIAFENLAVRAGLDPDAFKCGAEWIKDDTNRLHIVRRYDSAGRKVVLKYAMRPADPAAFGRILDATQQAHDAVADSPVAHVPHILAQDRTAQACLMTYFPGETLLDLCRTSRDHTAHLRAAGTWLAAFHAGTFTQTRAFQPKFMVRHMAHLSDQMARGERKIRGQNDFRKLAATLVDHAKPAEGYLGKISAKHGDLNAHNILIGDGTVAALDFLEPQNAPVAYDIARLLLSYVQMVGDIDTLPRGHVVPPDAFAAFFDGYSFVEADDPTVHFLLKVQVLTDWNRMQDKSRLRGLLRYERIRQIARQAFG
ncbi:phosphotransferase [Sulfitobacter sp. S190]|uniref:phosphotransferase n=1 Tax=Sulfitobacter sp. S190 TaxID=2867022 RepID=UPI0021A92C2C|nr:phosphotransferase [Sulfitobacter sp. S190]UWR22457.1 phosphotransferase [Sulfitobacter sp. S190]